MGDQGDEEEGGGGGGGGAGPQPLAKETLANYIRNEICSATSVDNQYPNFDCFESSNSSISSS